MKCIKLMISYGISFGNFEDEIYEPPLEAMITISKRRPEVILTKIARILMKSNFKTLKEMVEVEYMRLRAAADMTLWIQCGRSPSL